jgi:protein phosphatase
MASSEPFEDFLFGKTCVVGRKRTANQDSADIFFPVEGNPLPPFMVLADGMGGHQGGEIASQIVLETFRKAYFQPHPDLTYAEILEGCVKRAHQRVKERAETDKGLSGMGSTVVAAFVDNDKIHLINVGDSRAYILRDQKAHQISQDQSFVADQVRAGLLTIEQARTHPKKNILSMAINAKRPVVTPVLNEVAFGLGDILLLCSDGLWGVVNESFLWAAANEFEPQEASEKLVAFANTSGGPDNISVLIARRKDWQAVKTISNDETIG